MFIQRRIITSMNAEHDTAFEKYLEGRVVLPIDHERSQEYLEYLAEVPEFEDSTARERAEKGALILTKIAVVGPSTGAPERRMLYENIECWLDPKTNQLWDRETFALLGEREFSWEHGNCVLRKEKAAYCGGSRFATRANRLNWYALRDAVERALWEQEQSIYEQVEEELNSVVKGSCETCKDIVALKKEMATLANENAELRQGLEQLRQQFNTFSLTEASSVESENELEIAEMPGTPDYNREELGSPETRPSNAESRDVTPLAQLVTSAITAYKMREGHWVGASKIRRECREMDRQLTASVSRADFKSVISEMCARGIITIGPRRVLQPSHSFVDIPKVVITPPVPVRVKRSVETHNLRKKVAVFEARIAVALKVLGLRYLVGRRSTRAPRSQSGNDSAARSSQELRMLCASCGIKRFT